MSWGCIHRVWHGSNSTPNGCYPLLLVFLGSPCNMEQRDMPAAALLHLQWLVVILQLFQNHPQLFQVCMLCRQIPQPVDHMSWGCIHRVWHGSNSTPNGCYPLLLVFLGSPCNMEQRDMPAAALLHLQWLVVILQLFQNHPQLFQVCILCRQIPQPVDHMSWGCIHQVWHGSNSIPNGCYPLLLVFLGSPCNKEQKDMLATALQK